MPKTTISYNKMPPNRHEGTREETTSMGVELKTARKPLIACGLAVLLAVGVTAPSVRAQTAEPPPGPLAKPNTNPRDFSGMWQIRGYAIRYPVVGGGEAPYLPWAK